MMEFNPTSYSVIVQHRNVEGHPYFVGTVLEFPDIEAYEDSYIEAYEAVIGIISDLNESARDQGKSLPSPNVVTSDFSGRITLRVPRWLHQRLDEQARQNEVSLNTHISTLLVEGSTRLACRPNIQVESLSVPSASVPMAKGYVISLAYGSKDTKILKVVAKAKGAIPPIEKSQVAPPRVQYVDTIQGVSDTLNKREISYVH
jgi:hypothetical protein